MDELDAGVKRLLVRVEELKNGLQPIQQLPPDVVVEIATYLNPRECQGGDCQPIMAMSQVCRYWREILISNPESWCFVSSGYLDLIPLFLERSGSYPLEVHLTDTWFCYAVRHVIPHANRLAILRCRVEEAGTILLRMLTRLPHPPNLHTFSITSLGAPIIIPEFEMPFVSGNMPNLRTLELFPFPVIPQFVRFKHLVNLQLEVTHSTLTAVLDLLVANPSLEKVRLIGNFEDSEDARAAGSVALRCLQFLSVERCVGCKFLEKLTLPRKARIFIRYNIISRLVPFAFTLPQSMGDNANLQGLTSLHMLMAFTNDTYTDITGPNGSIAMRFAELQYASPICNAIASLSTTGITRLVCEFHPALGMTHIEKVTRTMGVLPHLEEIKLVHFGGKNTQDFLSALRNTNGWTKLLRLEFVHCRQITGWIVNLIRVALGRKGEGLTLDTVTIVHKKGERLPELLERLEMAVGRLRLVGERAEEVVRSELVWDDTTCTARVTSVSAGWD